VSVAASEDTFDQQVLERSHRIPVVVDFWADWCGPCKALSPALEEAAAAREGKVELVTVDVEANQQLAALFRVQGIPTVMAFDEGQVIDEFTGALPPARVEAFFDGLVPSRADELLTVGDEPSLREAAELEPRRIDIAIALALARLGRGADDEALEAVAGHDGDFAAAGIAARIRLVRTGVGGEAFAALDRGDRVAALDGLLAELGGMPDGGGADGGDGLAAPGAAGNGNSATQLGPNDARGNGNSVTQLGPGDARDLLRRAVVGILSDLDPADPTARTYRRKLAAALG
jgi:putative thioredoxin